MSLRRRVQLALLCMVMAGASAAGPRSSPDALGPSGSPAATSSSIDDAMEEPSTAAQPASVQPASTQPAIGQPVGEQQLLLMLRAPPQHFSPNGYAGDYLSAPGRHARRRIVRQLAHQHGLRLVDDWPMPALGLDCFVLAAADGAARARVVQQLAADPRVESVQPMQVFHALGAGDPLSAAQPVVTRWHLRELHALATGKHVVVAVLDTGVDLHHPDLRGQVAVMRNFVDGGAAPAEAHGTQIAGIISARVDDGIGIAGIAPQARLLALRACWQQPGADGATVCSSFTLAKALQFALDANAQVLNLSLTGPPDRLLARLLDVALRKGVTVVGAVDQHAANGGFPATHPGVLAVAGLQDQGTPPGVLRAPGRGVPATMPGGGWDLVSGSSFAAAQVTGLVALLRELSPRVTPAQLRAALVPTSGLGLASKRPTLIDACAAVVHVAQRCACDCGASLSTASSTPRR